MTNIKHLTGEDFPTHFQARAGLELQDWAGDTLRVSDGGDGSVYVQIAPFDVSVHPAGVMALRDYLTEVLKVAEEGRTEAEEA